MLALGITLVAWFFVALTESNLDAAIGPLPLGTYLGALVGMEAMAGAGPGAAEPSSVEYGVGMLELAGRTPPTFSPPLEGEGWLAVNGCCGPEGVHRSAVLAVNGVLYDSQRFAIDWMRLNEDGQLVVGDPSKTENYVGYGAKVMATADGVVVGTLDELEDNVPGQLSDPNSITIETVDGNHVIIDHGNGLYSFYAHPRKAALRSRSETKSRLGTNWVCWATPATPVRRTYTSKEWSDPRRQDRTGFRTFSTRSC
jgi:hypothetical protein